MAPNADRLVKEIMSGSRVALARAITLIESTRADHRRDAENLLSKLIGKTGNSLRVAISGPPGVGKSTFIEALGLHVVSTGKKLAVLAIDPSSPITGGSILGDKTRMEELSKAENCFIRPSPSSGTLGGVGKHTRESMLLCEAAGFDVVFVETVGIGQSEYVAASMTDIFVQLHQPFSGDELQGIKKGVMELADLIIVTKADGDSKSAAELAKKDLERAISLVKGPSGVKVEVITISSKEGTGIQLAWSNICSAYEQAKENGSFTKKRIRQSGDWLNQEILNSLRETLESHPKYENMLHQALEEVQRSNEHTAKAGRDIVRSLLKTID